MRRGEIGEGKSGGDGSESKPATLISELGQRKARRPPRRDIGCGEAPSRLKDRAACTRRKRSKLVRNAACADQNSRWKYLRDFVSFVEIRNAKTDPDGSLDTL